jgi:hypothetical protein
MEVRAMIESATSTLEYRRPFGRRPYAATSARDAAQATEARRSVDADTAALRQRILAAGALPRSPVGLLLAR